MDYLFEAQTVAAYFDEDTVYDSEEIHFKLSDVRNADDRHLFVTIRQGGTEYIQAIHRDTVKLLSPVYDTGS